MPLWRARHGHRGRCGPGGRTHGVAGAIAPATRPTGPAAIRRSQFERLTAGVLDGIQPPRPPPCPIRARVDQMKDPARLMSRSGFAAAAMVPGRSSALERHQPATLRPGPGCSSALLLAVAAPAYGFDGEEQSPQSVDDLVLHGFNVPAAANWVVLDATGIAAWRAEGETRWQRFRRGEVLPPGCEIETGSDGEVTLVAGGDQLTIAPQGRLIVPIAQPGQDRRLRHERGRILVQIESREARDVRVDTPLLSLGIKGTTFEVLVEPTQDSVLVHEGDVEVTTPGGERRRGSRGRRRAPSTGRCRGARHPVHHAGARKPGGGGGRADLALGPSRNGWPRPAGCA